MSGRTAVMSQVGLNGTIAPGPMVLSCYPDGLHPQVYISEVAEHTKMSREQRREKVAS